MTHDEYGEINHDVTLMRANAAYRVTVIDRSNVTPHRNGLRLQPTFRTSALTESQRRRDNED